MEEVNKLIDMSEDYSIGEVVAEESQPEETKEVSSTSETENQPAYNLSEMEFEDGAVEEPIEVELDSSKAEPIKEEPTPAPAGGIDLASIARAVPDKLAFKIGEVADLTQLKPYVLRYWESEFDSLRPQKSAYNQRMYSKKDVETVLLIKKLLYDEKFSIAGAKKKIRELRKELKAEKKRVEAEDKYDMAIERFQEVVADLKELKATFV